MKKGERSWKSELVVYIYDIYIVMFEYAYLIYIYTYTHIDKVSSVGLFGG